ncbi:unnamed protein product [Moneuplotes crassus]|uniref:Uncharacterized protein n=1 Tax=Euplotes crassus TaxID=5936 RepID=A0AAD1U8P1_EUPCR|nr:unnamed protein product [Moneuplotes crassus]
MKKINKIKKDRSKATKIRLDSLETKPIKLEESKSPKKKKQNSPRNLKKSIQVNLPEIPLKSPSERRKSESKSPLNISTDLVNHFTNGFTALKVSKKEKPILKGVQSAVATPKVKKVTKIFTNSHLSKLFKNAEIKKVKQKVFERVECPFENKNIKKSLDSSWILPTISSPKKNNRSVGRVAPSTQRDNETINEDHNYTKVSIKIRDTQVNFFKNSLSHVWKSKEANSNRVNKSISVPKHRKNNDSLRTKEIVKGMEKFHNKMDKKCNKTQIAEKALSHSDSSKLPIYYNKKCYRRKKAEDTQNSIFSLDICEKTPRKYQSEVPIFKSLDQNSSMVVKPYWQQKSLNFNLKNLTSLKSQTYMFSKIVKDQASAIQKHDISHQCRYKASFMKNFS